MSLFLLSPLDVATSYVHCLSAMSEGSPDGEGQLHTIALIEQLREESKHLWDASSRLYFRVDELLRELANPNLHDIPTRLPFRVEMWDRAEQHVRWVIAASSSVAIGHAALDAAIPNFPGQRFTLRNGILVIREHSPLHPEAKRLLQGARTPEQNRSKISGPKN
jgi:hypothetical protein